MTTIKHQTSFQINQSVEELFPLFGPESEKLWMPGWEYEYIMGSTDMHEDYIFLLSGSGNKLTKVIWLVKRYDPSSYFVQSYRVEPYDTIGIVTVHCKPITVELTEVEVSNEYIGLSKKGDEFIKERTAEGFKTFIDKWKVWL